MSKNNLTGRCGSLPAVPATFPVEELWDLSENTQKCLQDIFDRLNAYEKLGIEPNDIKQKLARYEQGGWISVKDCMPEDLPENKGKKIIPCFVAVKSRYPKGKPNIEKRQRQWLKDCNGEFVEWEWSRLRCEQITHWMPLPKPPKER